MKDNLKIAIVGNSPCILEHEWGEEIDNHDIVVRFNDFITEGYEKYTGSKTTDVCVCTMKRKYSKLDDFLKLTKEHRFYREDVIPLREDIFNQMMDNKITPEEVTLADYEKYHIELSKKIHENAGAEWNRDSKQPSSGMMMLQYFLDKYPEATLDAYGFDFFTNPRKIHFYDKVAFDKSHQPDYEKRYFHDILSQKINLKK